MDPVTVTPGGADTRAIVVCDGSASWGFGREAARDAAGSIRRAIERDGTLAAAGEIVFAASRRARAEFGLRGEDAPLFSVLIALAGAGRVELAWVGDVYARLVRDGRIVERAEPHVAFAGGARAIARALPGQIAWERECFLERRSWALLAGDRVDYGAGAEDV